MKHLKFTKKEAKSFLEKPLSSRKTQIMPRKKMKFKERIFFSIRSIPYLEWKKLLIPLIPLWILYIIIKMLLLGKTELQFHEELISRLGKISFAYTVPLLICITCDFLFRLMDGKVKTLDATSWNRRYFGIWIFSFIISVFTIPGLLWNIPYLDYDLFSGFTGNIAFFVLFTFSMNQAWRKGALLYSEELPSNPVEEGKQTPYDRQAEEKGNSI
ncbi:MAG: hypothetical protein JXA60_06170 [Candidatus Coatesbacteria bacterium]|nr:hypothetical protein [Candidatus Coatesbacteria bacterium]